MARLYRSTAPRNAEERVRERRQDRPAAVADRGQARAPEDVAIRALGFIAGDPELLPRFLALTGIEPQGIRQAAAEPGFLAGVLQFVLAHEPTLMKFAAEAGIAPATVGIAAAALPLGNHDHERSI